MLHTESLLILMTGFSSLCALRHRGREAFPDYLGMWWVPMTDQTDIRTLFPGITGWFSDAEHDEGMELEKWTALKNKMKKRQQTKQNSSYHISSVISYAFFKRHFCAFHAFIYKKAEGFDRKWGKERKTDMQQRATRWDRTWGCCSESAASVHGAPAPPTELPGCPGYGVLSLMTQTNLVTMDRLTCWSCSLTECLDRRS